MSLLKVPEKMHLLIAVFDMVLVLPTNELRAGGHNLQNQQLAVGGYVSSLFDILMILILSGLFLHTTG